MHRIEKSNLKCFRRIKWHVLTREPTIPAMVGTTADNRAVKNPPFWINFRFRLTLMGFVSFRRVIRLKSFFLLFCYLNITF